MRDEAVRGVLPALGGERVWNTFDSIMVQTAFSIATWLFMMGAWTGFAVPAVPAIAAAIFANTIVHFFMSRKAQIFARYGVDEFIGARAIWGSRGGNEVYWVIFTVMNMGWISIPVVMFGYAWVKAIESFGYPTIWYAPFAVLCFALAAIIVYVGPTAMKWVTRFAAPAMMILIGWFAWHMIMVVGWRTIAAIRPEGFFGDRGLDYAWAVEGNIGLGFSWVPYYGSYYRLAKSERAAYYGTFVGWGFLWGLLCIPAIFVALLIGSLDPTDWMIEVGGPLYGLVGLGLLVIANVSSAACVMYTQTCSMKSLKPSMKWRTAVLFCLPAFVLVFWPAAYDYYGGFVGLIAAILAPMGAVMVVDVIFISKGRYRLIELYKRKGTYYFWGGFNIVALLCAFVGMVISFSIFNPWTFAIHQPEIFRYITAAAPSCVAAGLLYLAAGKAMLRTRKGKMAHGW